MMRKNLGIFLTLLCLGFSPIGEASPYQNLDDIAQRATAYAKEKAGQMPGRVAIQLTPLDNRLKLPVCRTFSVQSMSKSLIGLQQIKVMCLAPNPWTVYVPLKVQIFAPVQVSARPLNATHHIKPGDIALVEKDLGSLTPGYLGPNDPILDQELSSNVPAGMVLRKDMLRISRVVVQGQNIAMIVQSPGLRLIAEGTAMQDGRPGQLITVRNNKSGKQVKGLVQANGEVMIPF